jgi:hypothetical protein
MINGFWVDLTKDATALPDSQGIELKPIMYFRYNPSHFRTDISGRA